MTRMNNVSKFLRHIPCDKCGSSDACGLFNDGHTWCYACNTYKGQDSYDVGTTESALTKFNGNVNNNGYNMSITVNGSFKSIPDRAITLSTTEKYGVLQDEYNSSGATKHYYPYTNDSGDVVAFKVRDVPTKAFTIKGDFNKARLFGQNLFHTGGKYVTLVEGELDAMAAYQMTGSQWPCLSIRNGANAALKDCKANYEWLNTFDNIVICFDGDEPGIKAAKEVAELFGSKAKVMKHLEGSKDACDYLVKGATKEFINAWWKAEAYKPDGIINGVDLWDELRKPRQLPDAQWPYGKLDEMLAGLRKRELITIAAGTGQGKSTFLRQLIHHLLMTTEDNIGMAFLEESPARTAMGIMSIEAKKPLHLPTTVYTEQELQDAFDRTMGSGRCVMFNHFGSLDIDSVLNRLRWMAKGQGCSWIILDHYQMILSGMDTDERKGLDMLLTRLRTFVEETGVGLFGVSHTRRQEGKGLENGAEISLSSLRGTQGISQLSDAVIGLQRDQQHEDEKIRNTTEVRLLKSRFTGETGPAGHLYFSKGHNRLIEIDMTANLKAL